MLLLISVSGYAQIQFRHFTTQDGLPHDFTFELLQDDKGYIWIGTDDGLAKFNGTDFKVFDQRHGLRSNYVTEVDQYNADTLAVATWKGGLHFMVNDSIILPQIQNDDTFLLRNIITTGKDIVGTSILSIYCRYKRSKGFSFKRDTLIFYEKDSGNITLNQKYRRIKMLASNCKKIDSDLYFYKGTHESDALSYLKGIRKFTKDTLTIPVFPFLKNKEIDDFGIYKDHVYYATVLDTLYLFNRNNILQKIHYNFNNNSIHQYAKTSYCEAFVIRDQKTGNDNVHIYDLKNDTWIDLSQKTESTILVSDLLVDKNENIWITSKADGLYQIGKDLNRFEPTPLKKEHIITIMIGDRDEVFFSTLNNLYSYNTANNKINSKFFKTGIQKFASDQVLDNKINVYTTGDSKFPDFILSGNVVTARIRGIKKSGSNYLYFSNNLWLQQDKCTTERLITPLLNQTGLNITDVAFVDHRIWIGTISGIILFDTVTDKSSKQYFGYQFPKEWIRKIVPQQDVGIWIVTNKGLSLIQNNGNRIDYTEKNGLQNSKINDIFVDHFGVLWIGTQRGLSVFQNQTFYNFGIEDHLPFSFVSDIQEDKKHQVWISGNKGVVKVDNSVKPFTPYPSPALVVDHKKALFTIDIIDYSGKESTLQYRSGTNEDWQNITTNQLDISRYGIGTYNLQFRVRHSLSNWAYSPSFDIEIPQVWYKKTLFVVLCFFLSCVIIGLLAYYRIRVVTKRNTFLQRTIDQSIQLEQELSQVRENVAQDFHDELGNKLAGITILSQMMLKNEELMKSEAAPMISQVRKDADDLYFGIKDFVWSIDSKSDNLYELIYYLTDFGEELFEPLKIKYKVEKYQITPDQQLPYYWSRQLLLLFKEVMTNSFKHSMADTAILKFSIQDDILTISFYDNGKGFAYDELTRKNGLLNMTKRAQKIGGTLEIQSKKGTKIRFTGALSQKLPQKGEDKSSINTEF